MTDQEIVKRIRASNMSNLGNVTMLFSMAQNTDDLALCKEARKYAERLAVRGDMAAYELVKETYKWAAPKDFDSYLLYLEWNRSRDDRV